MMKFQYKSWQEYLADDITRRRRRLRVTYVLFGVFVLLTVLALTGCTDKYSSAWFPTESSV